MAQVSRGYVKTLDGWRAIAVVWVIFAHAGSNVLHGWPLRATAYTRGVELFFGISGFLICSRLLEERSISLRRFYVRRFCRILPAAFLYLAVIGLLHITRVLPQSGRQYLAAMFFVLNYVPGPVYYTTYVAHFWSLCVEEHFYFFWPTLLKLSGRRLAVWLAPVMAVVIGVWRHFAQSHGWGMRWFGTSVNGRSDTRMDALLYGCLLAFALSNPRIREVVRFVIRPPVWIGIVGFYAFDVIARPPLTSFTQPILVPLILAGTILWPESTVGRILELWPLRFVGRISYSLYLWQELWLVASSTQRPLPFGKLQEWPWGVLPLLACAALSYYVVELPMIRIGHKLAPPVTAGREDLVDPARLDTRAQAAAVAA